MVYVLIVVGVVLLGAVVGVLVGRWWRARRTTLRGENLTLVTAPQRMGL